MKFRILGSTGLRVSVVGLGTWQFGGEWGTPPKADEVAAMLDRARDLGVNLIDTAECYGDHESERRIGAALNKLGNRRDDWIICSKFGHKFHGNFDRTEPRKPADVREQTEASLKALELDYLDVQQYHSWGDEQFFDDDVLAELHKLKDEGKFRHLANSVGSNANVKQVAASRDRRIEAIQIIYNRLDTTPEEEVFNVCREQNLGLLARVPLASGYLTGKYQPGHTFDKGEVRGRHGQDKSDAMLERAEQIKRDEYEQQVDSSQVSMATWALSWCLRHPAVTCVIPGVKNVQQVESNAAAATLFEE
jgi:aryl-alcohol dehydrogenase-like predicted oxidoreductase